MVRQELKNLLEAIGMVAIIASLIFVGIETRNSTQQAILTNRALEIAAYQELMDNIAEMNMVQMQDPELAGLMFKARRTSEELTDIEKFRMNRFFFLKLRHGDMAFFQYERGAIDEARLRSALKVLDLTSPEMRAFWQISRENFVESYRHYIDSLIEEFEAEVSQD